MTSRTATAARAHPSSDGSALRFCDGVARILSSPVRSVGAPSVVELTMPEGSQAPLRAQDEDATVVLLEGRVTFTVGEETIVAGPRTRVHLPAGVPHTHRVDGGRARWLVQAEEGRFERFVRAVARPAEEPVPPGIARADAAAFTAAAVANGIDLLAAPARRRKRRFSPARSLAPVVA